MNVLHKPELNSTDSGPYWEVRPTGSLVQVKPRSPIAPDSGIRDTDVFVLGSPFSGSTMLTNMLNAHPKMVSIGEPDRLPGFSRLEHLAEKHAEKVSYQNSCIVCSSRECDCPVWTPSLMAELEVGGAQEFHGIMRRHLKAPIIVDSSKTVEWFADAVAPKAATERNIKVILIARVPHAFAFTHRLLTGDTFAESGQWWFETYERTLRELTERNQDYMVLRFEDLCLDPFFWLRRVCDHIGIYYDTAMMEIASAPLHVIGGNRGAHTRHEDYVEPRVMTPSRTYSRRPFGGWVQETWKAYVGADGAKEINGVDGLPEMATLLGYSIDAVLSDIDTRHYSCNVTPETIAKEIETIDSFIDQGNTNKALGHLSALIFEVGERIDEMAGELPSYLDLLVTWVHYLTIDGRVSEARRIGERFLTKNGEASPLRFHVARACIVEGDWNGAVGHYGILAGGDLMGTEEVIAGDIIHLLTSIGTADPNFFQLVNLMPQVLANASLQILDSATQDETVVAIRGAILYGAGRKGEARAVLEQGLSVRSDSTPIQDVLFHIQGRQSPGDESLDLSTRWCSKPFYEADILPNGDVFTCCTSWMPKPIGNVFSQSAEEIWNGPVAQDLRRSIHDGSFKYCNKVMCRAIQGGLPSKSDMEKTPAWGKIIQEETAILDKGIDVVNLSYDRTCNLTCPTCRTDKFVAKGAERDSYMELTDRVVLPMLQTAQRVFVTGSGDPFVSRVYRHVLKTVADHPADYPDLKFRIMTNGLLMTPNEWARYEGLKGRIDHINISIDAATEETYRVVRRGGEFADLYPNLLFTGELLKKGEIDNFVLNFVVQRDNFREMPDVVDLAHKVGATKVNFQRLTNWNTFTNEEYEARCVFHAHHPLYREFLTILEDPRLKDPMVDLGVAAFAQEWSEDAQLA